MTTELSLTLDRGRAWRRMAMLDTVTVVRPGTRTYNPATKSYDEVGDTIIYIGPARLVVWRGNEEQAADTEVAVIRYRLELPADGTVPALARYDRATVTASVNPALTDRLLVLTEPEFGTTSTALRWIAEVSA